MRIHKQYSFLIYTPSYQRQISQENGDCSTTNEIENGEEYRNYMFMVLCIVIYSMK